MHKVFVVKNIELKDFGFGEKWNEKK